MAGDARSQVHEMGLRLAEEGRYAEGLAQIREHLRLFPKDVGALNDAGVILYCMGDNEGAINCLEKAKAHCSESEATEINWNLCEAYLGAGFPGLAMKLFDEMERQEILNPDLLNRGANAFLGQEMYGHAIELLVRSLEMMPSQEILEPMIEVIRSHRATVGVFARERTAETERLFDYVDRRFTAALHTGASRGEIRSLAGQYDIVIFDGCWDAVIDASYSGGSGRYVLRLSDEDVYGDAAGGISLGGIDTLVVSHNPAVRERLCERYGDVERQVKVVAAGSGVDARRYSYSERARGKRIACLDDLTLRNNPMMLLQCMQKLHYIDADYRLYFAGGFEDGATEDYLRHITAEMGLSDVVLFEGGVRNEASWLRDKHFVVTASVTASGLGGVLKGMSCGLKPVVHNFAGARGMFEGEFLFNIAEDFCGQVLSERYEPGRYRRMVETRYSTRAQLQAIGDVLFRLERGVVKDRVTGAAASQDEAFGARRAPAAAEAVGAVEPVRPTAVEEEPVWVELPQIAWSDEGVVGAGAEPVESGGVCRGGGGTAAEHLCGRVGSINQMSADVLREWKAFAQADEGGGADVQDARGGFAIGEFGGAGGRGLRGEEKTVPFV